MTHVSRRALLSALPVVLAACARREPPSSSPGEPSASTAPSASGASAPAPSASAAPRAAAAPNDAVETRVLSFEGRGQRAVLVVPGWLEAGARVPLLVALHGLGEQRKGVEGGSWGWVRDYALDRAMARLRTPPLVAADFQGFVTKQRLAAINASLAARPFRGLVVACPYTPDLIAEKSLDNAGPFGRFVTDELLPRARAEAPVLPSAAATGIDGVSLGGRVALLVGLAAPDRFGAVGSLQAALQVSEATPLARRAKKAREATPSLGLRLVTSEKDFYKAEIGAFSAALRKAGVEHDHVVLPGPHDYPWNRGPGAIEMLLFHDRVLRGEPPDPRP